MLAVALFFLNPVAAQDTDSREYKLLLDPAKFSDAGPRDNKPQSINTLGALLQQVSNELTGKDEDWNLKLKKTRLVSFLDVKFESMGCVLRPHNYILRERTETNDDGNITTLTLKYRNPDRLLVAYKNILTSDTNPEESKFEEDISPIPSGGPSFKSVYSRSVKLELENTLASDGGNLKNLFDDSMLPSLKNGLREEGVDLEQVQNKELQVVNEQQIYERVFKEKVKPLGHKVSFTLTLWYKGPNPSTEDRPIVAEISFSYEKESGKKFPPKLVRFAHDMFHNMQVKLGSGHWLAQGASTKTATLYGDFCETGDQ